MRTYRGFTYWTEKQYTPGNPPLMLSCLGVADRVIRFGGGDQDFASGQMKLFVDEMIDAGRTAEWWQNLQEASNANR